MRKFYSLVLMAAALLIGTNVWADDILVENHTKGTSLTCNDLQQAVDSVGAGDSATITLNNTIMLEKAVVIPHVTGDISQTNPNILNRAPQIITLNLNNNNIQGNDNATAGYGCIQMYKGKLHIVGTGVIKRPKKSGSSNLDKSVITLFGAPWDKKNVAEWTVLTIGENVTLNSNSAVDAGDVQDDSWKGNDKNKLFGLCIQMTDKFPWCYKSSDLTENTGKIGYTTNIPSMATAPTDKGYTTVYKKNSSEVSYYRSACAYGIKVLIKGKVFGHYRGINVNGNINATPQADFNDVNKKRSADYPYYAPYYYPYVKIDPSATIWCIDDGIKADGNGGIYAGGYVVWDISGYVHGQTGILAKSGDFILNDAVVASDSKEEGKNTAEYHKGETAGSGIFIASDASYAGGTSVTLEGDTKVSGNGSSAITDVVAANSTGSTVSHIDINSGTIEPGKGGAISIQSTTVEKTTVAGGNISGAVTAIDDQGDTTQVAVVTLIDTNTSNVTTVTDENGNTTYVVGPGKATDIKESDVIYGAGKDSIKWTGISESLAGNVKIAYLEINEMESTTPKQQTLTIPNGKTLEVGRVVLGHGAQIIVEAGAKFIVTGKQGIVAPSANNIVLQASELKQAIFLFNPAVTSNRHPKATVEFISHSYRLSDGSKFAWQRFGIPTHTALEAISIEGDIPTAFGAMNYVTGQWEVIGYINQGGADLEPSALNNSFGFYQMLHNTPTIGTKVTMKGEMVGNIDPKLNVEGHSWCGFANSYMATVNGEELLGMIPAGVEQSFQVYQVTEYQAVWQASSFLDCVNIEPMQPFLINNPGAASMMSIGYNDAVYKHATKANAPARRVASNMTKAKIIVKGENCIDRVVVAEDEQFSAEFDNGYDASKFMNDGINMYVSANEKMAHFATNDLSNTFVGFQTTNGGNYTIEFANVQGAELTLVDHETGARVAMVEGNAYEFTAAANSVNDYRFEIVESAKLPTAIENTEAVKSAKGIYTITGQFVGEMNVWNTLPAGIYVVNGEKRVK